MELIQAGTGTAARRERLAVPVVADGLTGVLRLRKPVRFAHRLALLRMTGFGAIVWLCAGGVSVAQTPAATKSLSSTEQSLIANEKSLIEAKKKDDRAFFKQTVSDDFALVGVDGKLLERQEALDNLGDSELIELTPYDIKVLLAGDAAIVTYDAVVREKPQEDQGPPPRYQHFSSVWVMQGDAWKLKFHQATAAHWGDW